ncbi:MAG: NAD(P)-dependent oxidoreductase [Chitinophagaceae bacterium]
MTKLFVYSSYSPSFQQYLVQHLPENIATSFKTNLPDADARKAFREASIVAGNPPLDWFDPLPEQLTFWQLDSAGFEKYSQLALTIPVANMGDFFARPCAETIVGGVLAWYRGIPQSVRLQDAHHWNGKAIRNTVQLLGRQQVIVLGAGAIGMAVKEMLTGFGCTIHMAARSNPAATIHSKEELLQALSATNLVINTLPGSADKYMTEELFAALPNGSVYASVGRGNTTDETAMIAVLQSGKLAGAVLDVTEKEPLPADNPLWNMPEVILTQHSGGGRADEDTGKIDLLIANINSFIKGGKIENPVTLSRGY